MVKTRTVNNKKPITHIETITMGKTTYKVINRSPKDNPKNVKEVERQLFQILKKYEPKTREKC